MKFDGVYVFKEKNIEKNGRKRERQRAKNAIEKKAYRDKFYLVA